MSGLLERLKKASKIELTETLGKSEVLNSKDVIHLPVPALNIAFSGDLDGGFMPGLSMIAGESRTFKSVISLVCAKAYMDKYDDAIMLFYDSEMGASKNYFNSLDIDLERVLHIPITDVEQFKFDVMAQLEEIKRGDHVIIVVDSIGNLASKKEVEDALNEKSAADMSRAKALKSLTRLITPHLNLKNIPMIVVNHTYQTLEIYSKTITGGGCVLKGTMVQMADGTMKPIEEITVGELVKTLDGDKEVTATWNPDTLMDGTPECYEVEFEDGTVVTCSDVHRFMRDGEWVEIQHLNVGDDLQTLSDAMMKITSIKKVGKKPVYDLSVKDAQHYVLKNGVVSHNTGLVYASDNILNITRSQQKNGTEIVGYDFNINVLKSRHSREKSRIPITVMFDSGINVWSGLLEMAVASGDVVKPSNGWYQVVDVETGEVIGNKIRAKDTNNKEFWDEILKRQHFKDWVKKTFMIANSKLLSDDKGEGEMPDSQFTME